jgi:biotin carboxyl carrier protein
MNGQVVKVPVQVGEQLESGSIVLILEAMKMENEVTAPIAGKLSSLNVAPGDTVNPGQTLFTIEPVE